MQEWGNKTTYDGNFSEMKDCCREAVATCQRAQEEKRTAREHRRENMLTILFTLAFSFMLFQWRNDSWDLYSYVVAGIALCGWYILLRKLFMWNKRSKQAHAEKIARREVGLDNESE